MELREIHGIRRLDAYYFTPWSLHKSKHHNQWWIHRGITLSTNFGGTMQAEILRNHNDVLSVSLTMCDKQYLLRLANNPILVDLDPAALSADQEKAYLPVYLTQTSIERLNKLRKEHKPALLPTDLGPSDSVLWRGQQAVVTGRSASGITLSIGGRDLFLTNGVVLEEIDKGNLSLVEQPTVSGSSGHPSYPTVKEAIAHGLKNLDRLFLEQPIEPLVAGQSHTTNRDVWLMAQAINRGEQVVGTIEIDEGVLRLVGALGTIERSELDRSCMNLAKANVTLKQEKARLTLELKGIQDRLQDAVDKLAAEQKVGKNERTLSSMELNNLRRQILELRDELEKAKEKLRKQVDDTIDTSARYRDEQTAHGITQKAMQQARGDLLIANTRIRNMQHDLNSATRTIDELRSELADFRQRELGERAGILTTDQTASLRAILNVKDATITQMRDEINMLRQQIASAKTALG